MDQGQINSKLAAQLGGTSADAARYGKITGALYSGAIVDSVEDAAEVVRGIAQHGLLPPGASKQQMTEMATHVADTATLMGEDFSKVSAAVSRMLKSGIAGSATEAMDVLVRGTQIGVNSAEDLLDTFVEYSVQFKKVGLDSTMALGLMQQALQGGARDADTAADAVKEFSLLSIDGSQGAADAYKALGLDAKTMIDVFAKGGPGASAALNDVFARIRAIKDPATASTVAVGLFGTKAEDLGQALSKMDPSTAVAGLGEVAGAADKAGATLRDNAGVKVEQFKRHLTQAFVEVLGDKVVPRLITFGGWLNDHVVPAVRSAGGAVRDDLVPVLREVGGWLNDHVVPAAMATGRVLRDDVVPAVKTTATWIGNNREPLLAVASIITIILLPAMVAAAAGATVSAATQVAAWILTRTTATTSAATSVLAHWAVIGGWIAAAGQAVVSAAVVVAQWVLMGSQALIRGAQMALAWLIGMGPVGWAIALVIAVAAAVIYWWDEIVGATRAAWGWVSNLVTGAWRSVKGAASDGAEWVSSKVSGMVGSVTGFFGDMKRGAVAKGEELMAWVRGLPGDVLGGLGDLQRLLWNAGVDIVKGLINGAKSMFNDVKSTLSNLTDMLPDWKGPPATDAKLLTANGRLVMQGFMRGIDSQTPALRAQLGELTASMPSMAMPARIASVGGTTPVAAERTGPMVQINGGWHSSGETPEQMAHALDWELRGR
nr:phage tail tape measure protein [Streptomyces sp. SID3343]